MHDFLQTPIFLTPRAPVALRPSVPDWVQRGLMRSFGDDDLPAYHPAPRAPRPRRATRRPGSRITNNS